MILTVSLLSFLIVLQSASGFPSHRPAFSFDIAKNVAATTFLKNDDVVSTTSSTTAHYSRHLLDTAKSRRMRRQQQGGGAAAAKFHDPDIISQVQRQLQVLTVSEFCADLQTMELYITGRLNFFYNETEFLTEDGGTVCSCLLEGDDDTILDLVCGVFYYNDPDDEINNATTTTVSDYSADLDYMQLELSSDDGLYKPKTVGWSMHFGGSYNQGLVYREQFMLNSSDPTSVESCSITNSECNIESQCNVCDDGQTFSIFSGCDNETLSCEENYSGAFMYEYHLSSPIEVMADEPTGCVDAPTADEFCNDLSVIEMFLTASFRSNFEPDLQSTPYVCNCTFDGDDRFAVFCENNYTEVVENVDYYGREVMIFNEQNGKMIPSEMQWCQLNVDDADDLVCHNFLFALHQSELSYCEVVGECSAVFCELCSDGLTYASSCPDGPTCSDGVPGALLFAYKDTVIAKNQCPSAVSPSVSPVDDTSPTMAPMASVPPMQPMPTMPPVEEPTDTPEPERSDGAPTPEESKALSSKGKILSAMLSLSLLTVQMAL